MPRAGNTPSLTSSRPAGEFLKGKEKKEKKSKKQGKGLTLLLFTAWWGRKGGRKGRILSSARVFSSHSFEKDFKVQPILKIRWEVVGLTWRRLQAEAREETNNKTLDFQGPSFALE